MKMRIEMLIERLETEIEIIARLAREARDEMKAYREEGREMMADGSYASARYYEGIVEGKRAILADLQNMVAYAEMTE